MTPPNARLAVVDGCIGIGCPYCGAAIPKGSVRFHPAFDPGDGVPDARDVSWESRCPRCGGDFSIRSGTSSMRVGAFFPSAPNRGRELLMDTMSALESLEQTVADLQITNGQPRFPKNPIWKEHGVRE